MEHLMEKFTMQDLILTFLLGIIITTVINFFIIGSSQSLNNMKKLITECEYEIPRNKTCKIIAVVNKET